MTCPPTNNGNFDVMAQIASTILPLTKERFEYAYRKWCASKSRNHKQPFTTVDGRPIDLHALHYYVARAGAAVDPSNKELWPIIGAQMGFVAVPAEESQPAKSSVEDAQILQFVYMAWLAEFDRYLRSAINTVVNQQVPQSQPPPTSNSVVGPMQQDMGWQNKGPGRFMPMPMVSLLSQPEFDKPPSSGPTYWSRSVSLTVKEYMHAGPNMPNQQHVDMPFFMSPQPSQQSTPTQSNLKLLEAPTAIPTPPITPPVTPPAPTPATMVIPPSPTPAAIPPLTNDEAQKAPQTPMEKAEATVKKIKEEYYASLPLPSQSLPDDQKAEFIGLLNQLWALATELEPQLPKFYMLTKSDVDIKALVAIVLLVQYQKLLLQEQKTRSVVDLQVLRNVVLRQLLKARATLSKTDGTANGGNELLAAITRAHTPAAPSPQPTQTQLPTSQGTKNHDDISLVSSLLGKNMMGSPSPSISQLSSPSTNLSDINQLLAAISSTVGPSGSPSTSALPSPAPSSALLPPMSPYQQSPTVSLRNFDHQRQNALSPLNPSRNLVASPRPPSVASITAAQGNNMTPKAFASFPTSPQMTPMMQSPASSTTSLTYNKEQPSAISPAQDSPASIFATPQAPAGPGPLELPAASPPGIMKGTRGKRSGTVSFANPPIVLFSEQSPMPDSALQFPMWPGDEDNQQSPPSSPDAKRIHEQSPDSSPVEATKPFAWTPTPSRKSEGKSRKSRGSTSRSSSQDDRISLLEALPESEMSHIVQFPSPPGSPAGSERASWMADRDDLMVMATIFEDSDAKSRRSSTDRRSMSSTSSNGSRASSRTEGKKVLKTIGGVARIFGVW